MGDVDSQMERRHLESLPPNLHWSVRFTDYGSELGGGVGRRQGEAVRQHSFRDSHRPESPRLSRQSVPAGAELSLRACAGNWPQKCSWYLFYNQTQDPFSTWDFAGGNGKVLARWWFPRTLASFEGSVAAGSPFACLITELLTEVEREAGTGFQTPQPRGCGRLQSSVNWDKRSRLL